MVARWSSWFFGFGMIIIALIVPYIGGIVEFTLAIAAVTGGPLLAPPIWALFSKRITGKATLFITITCLIVNLIFKLIFPLFTDYKLSRANEMLLGVLLPTFLLLTHELHSILKGKISAEYVQLQQKKLMRKIEITEVDEKEAITIKQQNKFGLKVISFSLAFIAILLFILSAFTTKGVLWVAIIASIILISSFIILKISMKRVSTNNYLVE
jgi:hypothetical protein